MKKIIGILIALMLCLLVVGCSDNSASTTTTNLAAPTTTIKTVTTTLATTTTKPLAAVPTSADVRLLGKNGFDPETVTIKAGGSVTWIVVDTESTKTTEEINPGLESLNKVTYHVIAARDGSFRSERLGPGDKFSHTFTEKGTYEYLNVLYGVKGTVIVE